METLRILTDFHARPGSLYYEIAIGSASISLVTQYYLKKYGKEEAANLAKGLTLLGLGAVFVESIMKMLRLMSAILGV